MRFFNQPIIRAFVVVVAVGAALQAAAQKPKPVTIKPVRTFKGMAAVVEDTRAVFPQITEVTGPAEKEHDNPRTPQFGQFGGEPNSIFVGEPGTFTRIKPESIAKFPGISATGFEPPDCDFGIGPNHAIGVANVAIAFFDKNTGAKTFQQTFEAFFASVGLEGALGDPKVFYDTISGRWIVLCDAFPTSTAISWQYVAVSATSDPNGVWYKYKFDSRLVVGSASWWLDYPGLGGNKDAIVVTGNMFPLENASTYGGAFFMVIKKAPLLTGAAPTITTFSDSQAPTVQPMRTSDATVDKVYMVAAYGGTSLKVYAISNLNATPTLQSSFVTVPSWQVPSQNAASAGGKVLDSFDGRVYNAAWRGGKLYTAHSIRSTVSGSRVMCRWYDIATNNFPANPMSLNQAGNIFGPSGQDFHMPAINANKFGDVSIMYTRSSSSIIADLVVSAHKESDPSGSVSAPVNLESSTGSVYGGFSFRWGDYFALAVDPTDDATFWGYGMVGKSGSSWLTVFHKWTVSEPVPTEVDADTAIRYQGSSGTGDVNSIRVADGSFFTIVAEQIKGLGFAAAIEVTFTNPISTSSTTGMEFDAKLHGIDRATGMLYLYNWNTGKYEWIKSFAIKGVPQPSTRIVVPAPFTKYINGSNQVKAVLRATTPERVLTPFVGQFDLLKMLIRS